MPEVVGRNSRFRWETTSSRRVRSAPMQQDEVVVSLLRWAFEDDLVRAVILTSSRTDPARSDELSDYDIILAVSDADALRYEDAWQAGFGTPLVRWGDEGDVFGVVTYFRGVVYDNGVKIDYTIWPRDVLQTIEQRGELPNTLDAGYRVLLDKDGITDSLPPPTYTSYIPAKPSGEEYLALIEEFWFDTTYVAKALHRGELFFAKSFMFDHEIRLEVLARLFGWQIEIDHDWSMPLPPFGRKLESLISPGTWSKLAATYVGSGVDENWDALFAIVALFREIAIDVANGLGFSYPQPLEDQMVQLLRDVRAQASGLK
jgi:aminoglycoside 6-adenylyltransferase